VGLDREAIVYSGASMERPQLLDLSPGSIAVFTRRSPAKDTVNEDAIGIFPTGASAMVLAVADGLGGLPTGDQAAGIALQSLGDSLRRADPGLLREAILDGIEHANQKILSLGTGTATTLAVVEIRGSILRTYHVGDSGIMVTGQRGRRRLQTVSHSPTGYALEAGFIDEMQALNHDERNLVSNVVGSRELRIEIGSLIKLAPRDTVIVASDGLFDNLLSEEIIGHIRCGKLALSAQSLADAVLSRMGSGAGETEHGHADDLSFILYRRS